MNDSTPAELQRLGKMSRADAKLLRAISGNATFAEWVDGGARGSHRIADKRTLLVCAVVSHARIQARFMARHAPTIYIRPLS